MSQYGPRTLSTQSSLLGAKSSLLGAKNSLNMAEYGPKNSLNKAEYGPRIASIRPNMAQDTLGLAQLYPEISSNTPKNSLKTP